MLYNVYAHYQNYIPNLGMDAGLPARGLQD